jgi:hypothetical protein
MLITLYDPFYKTSPKYVDKFDPSMAKRVLNYVDALDPFIAKQVLNYVDKFDPSMAKRVQF